MTASNGEDLSEYYQYPHTFSRNLVSNQTNIPKSPTIPPKNAFLTFNRGSPILLAIGSLRDRHYIDKMENLLIPSDANVLNAQNNKSKRIMKTRACPGIFELSSRNLKIIKQHLRDDCRPDLQRERSMSSDVCVFRVNRCGSNPESPLGILAGGNSESAVTKYSRFETNLQNDSIDRLCIGSFESFSSSPSAAKIQILRAREPRLRPLLQHISRKGSCQFTSSTAAHYRIAGISAPHSSAAAAAEEPMIIRSLFTPPPTSPISTPASSPTPVLAALHARVQVRPAQPLYDTTRAYRATSFALRRPLTGNADSDCVTGSGAGGGIAAADPLIVRSLPTPLRAPPAARQRLASAPSTPARAASPAAGHAFLGRPTIDY